MFWPTVLPMESRYSVKSVILGRQYWSLYASVNSAPRPLPNRPCVKTAVTTCMRPKSTSIHSLLPKFRLTGVAEHQAPPFRSPLSLWTKKISSTTWSQLPDLSNWMFAPLLLASLDSRPPAHCRLSDDCYDDDDTFQWSEADRVIKKQLWSGGRGGGREAKWETTDFVVVCFQYCNSSN